MGSVFFDHPEHENMLIAGARLNKTIYHIEQRRNAESLASQ